MNTCGVNNNVHLVTPSATNKSGSIRNRSSLSHPPSTRYLYQYGKRIKQGWPSFVSTPSFEKASLFFEAPVAALLAILP